MLTEQFEAFRQRDTGIGRTQLGELERASSLPHAVIISGLRRAGKSTLLALASLSSVALSSSQAINLVSHFGR